MGGFEFVLERSDVELVEESSLGGFDDLTLLDDGSITDDLNLGLLDLSGNRERLEESSLLRVKSSYTLRVIHPL